MTDWRGLFGASKSHSLDYFPPTDKIVDGVITVEPPSDVFEEGVREWQYSLVAQFLGKAPNFSYLQRILLRLWEKNGFVAVKFLGSNLFLLQFIDAESRDWILDNGPWHVRNISMILRKWEPNMTSLNFDLDTLPLWVQLHQVPLELFSKPGLSYLASTIGKPLYMDTVTADRKRLSYARVCIEIRVGAEIPNIIKAVLRNGSTASIAVSLPWKPPCCSACLVFGHKDSDCPKAKKAIQIWQPKVASDVVTDVTNKVAPTVVAGASINKDVAADFNKVDKPLVDAALHRSIVVISPEPEEIASSDGFKVVGRKGGKSPIVDKSEMSSKKKGKLTGSSNKLKQLQNENLDVIVASCFDPLNDSQADTANIPSTSKEIWPQLIDNARVRRPRAASKGVAKVLQEIKSRKAKNLEKAKLVAPHLFVEE